MTEGEQPDVSPVQPQGNETGSFADGNLSKGDITRSLVLQGCQATMVDFTIPSVMHPYAAPAGWEDRGNLPAMDITIRAQRCESASVLGIASMEDVTFGWIAHSNISANDSIDDVSYNQLMAAISVFGNQALVDMLQLVNISADLGVVETRSGEALDIVFENGRVLLEYHVVGDFDGEPGAGYRALVVPSDQPDGWFTGDRTYATKGYTLRVTCSSEGETPLDEFFDLGLVGESGNGRLSPNGTLEVEFNA